MSLLLFSSAYKNCYVDNQNTPLVDRPILLFPKVFFPLWRCDVGDGDQDGDVEPYKPEIWFTIMLIWVSYLPLEWVADRTLKYARLWIMYLLLCIVGACGAYLAYWEEDLRKSTHHHQRWNVRGQPADQRQELLRGTTGNQVLHLSCGHLHRGGRSVNTDNIIVHQRACKCLYAIILKCNFELN